MTTQTHKDNLFGLLATGAILLFLFDVETGVFTSFIMKVIL